MPPDSSVERSIGIILGKLEGIEGQLKRQDESRAVLHERMNDLVMRTTHLETDILTTKNQVSDMKTVTDDVRRLTTEARGAGTAGRWLLRIGIALVTFTGWIVGLYTYYTGRPPP